MKTKQSFYQRNNKPDKREIVWSLLNSILIEGWHQGKLQSKTPHDYTLGTNEVQEWMRYKLERVLEVASDTFYPELLTPQKNEN